MDASTDPLHLPRPGGMEAAVTQLQRSLLVHSPTEAAHRVLETARAAHPRVAEASVVVVGGPSAPQSVATGLLAHRLDWAQLLERCGPAVTAVDSRRAVWVPNTREDARWPAFRDVAVATGALSVLAVPLPTAHACRAALVLYCAGVDGLTAAEQADLAAYAGLAEVALTRAGVGPGG